VNLHYYHMLRISSSDLESILMHSKEEYPKEACGIMKGHMKLVNGVRMNEVLKVYPTKNIHPNPLRGYKIHPEDQYRIYVELDPDLELVGFYHSHPHGPPAPSQTDVDTCNYHGYSFLIVSLEDRENLDVSAWSLYEDRVEEENIALSGTRV
jgi:proteasome lid subunit RPN8/RPN11